MSYEDVKDALYDIVSEFFSEATVIWAEQIATRPQLPYLTLKTNGITTDSFISQSGEFLYYNATTNLEINLYTQGKAVKDGSGELINYINTATTDLNDFVKYLFSDYGLDEQERYGLSISLAQPKIQDLSELQNDTKYRYRAFGEFIVSYIDKANGAYGLSNKAFPNSSGGGIYKMATTEVEAIEKAEIKEVNINEE